MKKHFKFLSIVLLFTFFFSSILPPSIALASINEPNPEGIRTGDKVFINMSPTNPPNLTANYENRGAWNVQVKGSVKGQSLYFQQETNKALGINLFHPSTISQWVDAFNGSQNYVTNNLSSIESRIRYQGNNYTRYYLRDLAELCGMHYSDSITWSPGASNINPTNNPAANLIIPANINPGGIIKWTASGQSYVKSQVAQRVNTIAYNLKLDGKSISAAPIAANNFTRTGEYKVPESTSPGTRLKFELTVTDGVGRATTVVKEVSVVAGKVDPVPEIPPKPEPPPPPPPPNYKPKADFNISNPSPIEGEKISFYDNSTHEGQQYGERIVSWEWTFEEIGSSYEQNPEATWNEVGTYKVTLRVEDQDGDSDSCTKSVVVGPAIPAAVITTSTDYVIIGREIHIDGDESTAAMNRDIKWDEMEWKFYNPNNSLAYEYTGRYPLGKGTDREKDLTNSVLNKTGNWRITLKVKDTNDNESEITEKIIQVLPDKPPIADFWLAEEGIRNSYEGYEITVRDLSTPDNPDGSLGDEIYERTWTLYYDANNDGNAKGSGDEIIHPGDKGKSAEIIQASNNDPRPVIRFNKTGRYQLELKVKERYDAWGETIEGLTADTEDKALEEKQIMVINLAPTVAFDIKKKTPVDILFATDYTVPDAKYNSLESGQPAFINELESGFVEPEVEVVKVKQGEVGQLWSVPTNNSVIESNILGDWYYAYVGGGGLNPPSSHYAINVSSGEVKQIKGKQEKISTLSDGTYIIKTSELVGGDWYWGYTYSYSYERVDKDFNIITSSSAYRSAINSVIPPTKEEQVYENGEYVTYKTTYSTKDIIFLNNGNILVWVEGQRKKDGATNPTNYYHHLTKINANLTKGYSHNFLNYPYSGGAYHDAVKLEWVNENNNQIFFSHRARYSSSSDEYRIISVGDLGVIVNLQTIRVSSSSTPAQPKFLATENNKFFITASNRDLSVFSMNGMRVDQKIVPGGSFKGEGSGLSGHCVGLFQWNEQYSVAIYQILAVENDSTVENTHLYLINNNTGSIETEKQFYKELYPSTMGTLGYTGNYRSRWFYVEPTNLNSNLIGITTYVSYSNDGYEDKYYYFSIINRDLDITYTSERYHNYDNTRTWYNGTWIPLTDQFAAFSMEETRYDGRWNETYFNKTRVFDANGNTKLLLPNKEGSENALRVDSLNNGYFYTKENNNIQMYSDKGVLLWQKPFTGIASKELFMGLILANPINLVNPSNGNIINTISHDYIFNTNNQLVVYGKNAGGARDGTFKGFGQLQGLQYLKQAIEKHDWDTNKFNVVVSVIDGDSFGDFETQKDSIKSTLQAKNLRLAVISPSTGKTKTQAEQLIIQNPDGGWWVQTASYMDTPLSDLAKKIIEAVNEDRGADNIVLVGQDIELKSEYKDPENDPLAQTHWEFSHDASKLGDMAISNTMGLSALHGKQLLTPPGSFDKAGTYIVKNKAKDNPVTNSPYLNHEKAGAKWSSNDAQLTVIVHRRPIADFNLSKATSTVNNEDGSFKIIDNSYDPDLINTDPEGRKGIRTWEWQYRNVTTNGDWVTAVEAPTTFPSTGEFTIRLRVQDAHGAWSNWSDIKTVTIANSKPIALFEPIPNPVSRNYDCTLVDHSYDPDGDAITEWEWTVQGKGTYTRTTSNPLVVSWPNVGNYTVTLRVKDSQGAWSDPYSQVVRVIDNNKPVAVLSLPEEGYADEPFTADGTQSYDPDPGDRVERAFWQFKKPNGAWSDVYTQHYGDKDFLEFSLTPTETELGIWTIRLVVADLEGLESDPVEKTILIREGFEVSGYVTPDPGERGRDMIITAFAHRKNNTDEKVEITNMKAYIIHPTKPDGTAAMADGQTPQIVNMIFDPGSTTYKYTFRVPEIIQKNRWPDDGTYYIRVVGRKGETEKETLLPANIKGHVQQRLYIKTRSW